MKSFIAFCLLFSTPLFAETKSENSKIIRVLSYNIRGLPFPLSKDKGRYAEIARLLTERQQSDEPLDFVVFQEMISSPSMKIKGLIPFTNYEGLQESTLRKGDGLLISTNHKVEWKKYGSANSCAVGDCFMRKGVLAIKARIEGLPVPLVLMTTHLQAHSEHDDVRIKQLDELYLFLLGETMYTWYMTIFAGDFNFKPRHDSYHYFLANHPFVDTGKYCLDNSNCQVSYDNTGKYDESDIWKSNNDRQFIYNPHKRLTMTPIKVLRNFTQGWKGGPDNELSDHWGYEVHYKVEW